MTESEHPIEKVILNSLEPAKEGEQFTIGPEGRDRIKACVEEAIKAGDIQRCRSSALVMIGFLMERPEATLAVQVLHELAKELGPAINEVLGEQASNLEQVEAARGRFSRMMNEKTAKCAPKEGESAPEGTIKQKDLAPPRNPRLMR